jgi:MFS family permease
LNNCTSRIDRFTPTTIGVVTACTLGNFISATPVFNGTFATFLLPISEEFGWPRAQVTAGMTIVAVIGLFGYALAGKLADHFGERIVLILGNIAFAAAIASFSLLQPNAAVYYTLFILFGMAATLPSTVVLTKVVSSWFVSRRGMVLGITAGCGISLGGMVFPRISQFLIDGIGWRNAYLILALLVLIIGQSIFWFLRVGPAAHQESPYAQEGASDGMTFAQALRTPHFWLMLAAGSLGTSAWAAFAVNQVAYASDRGLDVSVAIWSLMAMASTNGLWQVVMGRVLDATKSPRFAAPMVLCAIAGLALMMTHDEAWAWVLGGFLMGVASGAEYGFAPYAIFRYFGRRSYGQIYGFVFGVVALGMGFTPFLASAVFDVFGSYDPAFVAVGIAMAFGSASFLLLPRYDRADPAATTRAIA